MRQQLQAEAARLRELAARCETLATDGTLSARQVDDLRRAALACRAAAAELEAAADAEED